MGSFSVMHWLIVLAVVLLLFGGRGKISQLMGDFGKGLKSFKKGMGPDEGVTPSAPQPGTAANGEPRIIGTGTTSTATTGTKETAGQS
ncbi:MAG: twin-arginine translocase TatA/TatE family subunit [Rhodospirillales bacterium]